MSEFLKLLKKTPFLTAFFCVLIFLMAIVFVQSEPLILKQRYYRWQKKIPATVLRSEYLSVVVLAEQQNYIFKRGKFFKKYLVATGARDRYEGDRTLREGLWRLNGRLDRGLVPLYGPRLIKLELYLPAENFFTETLKAFHGTDEPEILGQPLSLGCVYHHNQDIIELYDLLPDNTLVIVTKN